MYCRFEDDDNFVEYYNLVDDPWQLRNMAGELSTAERDWYEMRLTQLRSCSGVTCRSAPEFIGDPISNSTEGPMGVPTSLPEETNPATNSPHVKPDQPGDSSSSPRKNQWPLHCSIGAGFSGALLLLL